MNRELSGGIVGVVLAGGRSQRMGGREKAFLELAGRPMLAHIIARFAPQVSHLAINANGDPARFAPFCLPVIADTVPDQAGPLAGVLAGLRWVAAGSPRATHMATVSSDAPFIPPDLVARLAAAAAAEAGDAIVVAQSSGVVHPLAGLWPLGIADALERALATGERRVQRWVESQGRRTVAFAPLERSDRVIDPFFNVNTPEDFAEVEALMQLLGWQKEQS
jgi:molybdopterin-guanine dinucleotide biosynthesis protein A